MALSKDVKTLRELRHEKNMSQVDLAIALDMSVQNYVNYERGYYKNMSEELEKKIAHILGYPGYKYKR